MALTNSDMRRFMELGASLEIVTFVTEIVTRHEIVTQRDGKAMTPAERARRYREKHPKLAVTHRDETVTAAEAVSPTPLSTPSLIYPVKPIDNKGFEEGKELFTTREAVAFVMAPVTDENVTRRDAMPKKRNAGTIMAEDFFPAPNVWNDPEISGLSEHDKQIELQAMKDWSASRTGSKGKMLDWDRFARGWFRRHAKERGSKNGNYKTYNKPATREEGFAQVRAVIAEAERREFADSGAFGEEDALLFPGLSKVAS